MNPNECPICYEQLINDTIKLPCNHIFHNECMKMWNNINNNTCPYCRFNLNPNKLPDILYDNLIHPDGNIKDLTVDNFCNFYYLKNNTYSTDEILEFIKNIQQACKVKSQLRICEIYKIKQTFCNNTLTGPKFGKLIEIGQINHIGYFPCKFQTKTGIQYRFYPIDKFIEVK